MREKQIRFVHKKGDTVDIKVLQGTCWASGDDERLDDDEIDTWKDGDYIASWFRKNDGSDTLWSLKIIKIEEAARLTTQYFVDLDDDLKERVLNLYDLLKSRYDSVPKLLVDLIDDAVDVWSENVKVTRKR